MKGKIFRTATSEQVEPHKIKLKCVLAGDPPISNDSNRVKRAMNGRGTVHETWIFAERALRGLLHVHVQYRSQKGATPGRRVPAQSS